MIIVLIYHFNFDFKYQLFSEFLIINCDCICRIQCLFRYKIYKVIHNVQHKHTTGSHLIKDIDLFIFLIIIYSSLSTHKAREGHSGLKLILLHQYIGEKCFFVIDKKRHSKPTIILSINNI